MLFLNLLFKEKKTMSIKKTSITLIILFLSFQGLQAQLYKVYGYQPAEAGEIEFSDSTDNRSQ